MTRPAFGSAPTQRSSRAVPYVRLVHAECPFEPDAVIELPPGESVVIGRAPGAGRVVELPDGWMSRQHARLTGWAEDDERGVRVEDLGSRNGTFVDGRAITGAALASPNSVLLLGSLSLVVGVREPDEGTGPAPPAGFSCLSPVMRALWRRVLRLAESDAAVLLLGELGTGKTRVASLIHGLSARGDGPFVAHNCSAIPVNLEEATLFGVVGGFIPSVKAQDGLLTRARGGTLFLDELADMPALAQAKLLDAFDPTSPSYLPVGATQRLTTNCRLVSATNRDVFRLASEGTVRQDLLSRLVVGQLMVPALRERREDLLPMFRSALRRAGADERAPLAAADVVQALLLARWSENVRGLESLAQRVALGEALTPALVQAHADRGLLAQPAPAPSAVPAPQSAPPAPGAVWPPAPGELLDLLAGHDWSITDAADALNVRRETLSRLVSRTFGPGKAAVQRAWRVWRASRRAPAAAQVDALYVLFCEEPATPANEQARAAWIERGEAPPP